MAVKRSCYLWSSFILIIGVICISIMYLSSKHARKMWNVNEITVRNLFQQEKSVDKKCIPVCSTVECVAYAKTLLSNMNPDVHPCDDFHSFLCAGFHGKYESADSALVLNEYKIRMRNKIRAILEDLKPEPGSAQAKMKTVYESCLNQGPSDLRAVGTFKKLLSDIGIPDWPHLASNFTFAGSSISRILGHLVALGQFDYIYFYLPGKKEGRRLTDEERNLKVFFKSYSFNNSGEIPDEAADHMLEYFDISREDIEIIKNDHADVRNSILTLIKEYINLDCDGNCSDPVTVVDCSEEIQEEWKYLCETIDTLKNMTNLYDHVQNKSVGVYGDIFMKNLFPHLNSTSHRSMANYLALDLLLKNMEELNFFFRLTKKKYFVNRNYHIVNIDRQSYCIDFLGKNIILPLHNEFIRHHVKPSSQKVIDIYEEIVSHVVDIVLIQEWIPLDNRSDLEMKMRNLSFNVKYLTEMLPNYTYANEYFHMLHPEADNFFSNVIQLKKVNYGNEILMGIKYEDMETIKETEYDPAATTGDDKIEWQFGMFFLPFYSTDFESLLNKITAILITGHEFGHNVIEFLDTLSETDNSTRDIYSEKKQCLVEQFSNYKFNILGENLNGSEYIDENLSDNLGVAVIDKIIKTFDTSEEFALPGLFYTTQQVLYMNANQIMCSKLNLKNEMKFKMVDAHAPYEFRLLGTMQNSKTFAEVFNCPDGSYMKPTTTCSFLDAV